MEGNADILDQLESELIKNPSLFQPLPSNAPDINNTNSTTTSNSPAPTIDKLDMLEPPSRTIEDEQATSSTNLTDTNTTSNTTSTNSEPPADKVPTDSSSTTTEPKTSSSSLTTSKGHSKSLFSWKRGSPEALKAEKPVTDEMPARSSDEPANQSTQSNNKRLSIKIYKDEFAQLIKRYEKLADRKGSTRSRRRMIHSVDPNLSNNNSLTHSYHSPSLPPRLLRTNDSSNGSLRGDPERDLRKKIDFLIGKIELGKESEEVVAFRKNIFEA